jgi:hypothetical protein
MRFVTDFHRLMERLADADLCAWLPTAAVDSDRLTVDECVVGCDRDRDVRTCHAACDQDHAGHAGEDHGGADDPLSRLGRTTFHVPAGPFGKPIRMRYIIASR